jgi:hypothetical protein
MGRLLETKQDGVQTRDPVASKGHRIPVQPFIAKRG